MLETDGLSLAATARLDLSDNNLVVDYVSASQLAIVQNWINRAQRRRVERPRHRLLIRPSGSAPYHHPGRHGGGRVPRSLLAPKPTSTACSWTPLPFVVKFTHYGDENFGGRVNFDDYAKIDAGVNKSRERSTQEAPRFNPDG